tara:strand:- start:388 stop:1884 length:1497 start_codon:yes stop_codon:yes gene_type:complete
MADIISNITNCTESTTTKSATLANSNTTYSIQGQPGTTKHLFNKTYTVTAGYVFDEAPIVSFLNSKFPNNYTVVITDTGGVSSSNLTVRSFDVYYKIPREIVTGDKIIFNAKADFTSVTRTGKITGYTIDGDNISSLGETRNLTIYGDPGATVDVNAIITGGASILTQTLVFSDTVSSTVISVTGENTSVYNGMSITGTNIGSSKTVSSLVSKTLTISSATSGTVSGNLIVGATGGFVATIAANGKFVIPLIFPTTSSSRTFTVTLTQKASNSFVNSLIGTSSAAVVIKQYQPVSVTLTLINGSGNSGDWNTSLTTPAIVNTGQADTTNYSSDLIPVSWNVYAASSGEILKTNAGFSIAAFTNSGGSAAGGQIIIGSDANTRTTIALENGKVTINNVFAYSNLTVTNTSGTNTMLLSVANANIYVGMAVTGTGVPNSTVVASNTNYSVTLNNVTTQAVTSATFTGKPKATISGDVRVVDRGQINAASNIEINNIITLQ